MAGHYQQIEQKVSARLFFTLNPNCFHLELWDANPTHQPRIRSLTTQIPEMNRLGSITSRLASPGTGLPISSGATWSRMNFILMLSKWWP